VFRRSGLAIGNAYGAGSGQIWLDNVECGGNENALEDCPSNNWGIHNCDHDEDVSITCSTNLTNNIGKI